MDRLVHYLRHPRLWRLRRHGIGLDTYLRLSRPFFLQQDFGVVLDIGAHVGHFALSARAAFPGARIVAFEPLPDCFAELQRHLAGEPGSILFNSGLGSQAGELSFERNEFTASSSFLKMSPKLGVEFPLTKSTRTICVPVKRLDDVMASVAIEGPMLVKIDVQGFEGEVLRGGRRTLGRAKVAIIETSLETLYEGQPSFGDLLKSMDDSGFAFGGTFDESVSPLDGRVLQIDAIFVRRKPD